MNANFNVKRIAVESIAYGLVLAVVSIAGAYLASQLVRLVGLGQTAQSIAANVVMAIVLVSAVAHAAKAIWRTTPSSAIKSDLTTDNDFVHVVRRTDDGYGLAVWDREDGVALLEIDDEGVAYEEVWVLPDEVEDVAAALEKYGSEKE